MSEKKIKIRCACNVFVGKDTEVWFVHLSSAILVAVPKLGSRSNLKGKKYAHLISRTELVRHAGGAGLLFWENIPFMLQDILILRLF